MQQLTHAHTHRETHTDKLANKPVWFSWVGLHLKRRQGEARNVVERTWAFPRPHWVESESLESWLVCVGVGVQLWWAVDGQWRVCVLRRKFSRDWRKERRALSSSIGEEPSSSTSAISAKVTGWVLNRASRGRRARLLPLAGPLGTGSCWGNSSMAEAIRWAGKAWKPDASITIWRTAAIGQKDAQRKMKWPCLQTNKIRKENSPGLRKSVSLRIKIARSPEYSQKDAVNLQSQAKVSNFKL